MNWPGLNPGELRERVTITRPVVTADISGQTVTMTTFLATWARITSTQGKDRIAAGQTTARLPIQVAIHWQVGILPNMQVVARHGTYVVESIENLQEMDVTLVLNCVALGLNG